jgi:hypothetical protein
MTPPPTLEEVEVEDLSCGSTHLLISLSLLLVEVVDPLLAP